MPPMKRSGIRTVSPGTQMEDCMARFTMVTIIGAGLMGHSLALLFAKSGSRVHLVDRESGILETARRKIEAGLSTLRSVEAIPLTDAEILAAITTSTDAREHAAESDLVLEAVSEKPAVKQAVYESLLGCVGPKTIVSSNTSALDVFEFMPAALMPRAAMTHFFVPPHLVPLVEVVPSPNAEADVTETLRAGLSATGAKPVFMKKFAKGFIINRLQRAYNREALLLVQEGFADARTIDEAVKASLAIRFPVMGIMEKNDQAGLGLILNNIDNGPLGLNNSEEAPSILRDMVAAGNTGFASGKGFYDYSGVDKEKLTRERDEKLLKVRKLLQEMGEL